jgi:hypothetical protein
MIEPTSVCELDVGSPKAQVPRFQSDEQIKEQISYLETRIERQRAIIEGLEAEGYGGEVMRVIKADDS